MKKKIPTFTNDGAAERFVATADLAHYDLSGARLMQFKMKREKKPSRKR